MIYKIGDIAKVMGVTTEAIRHYERMGLIKPEKDPQTNYRYFTEEQLSQLLYIQRLSQMGISLQLIREQFLNGSLHSYEQVISETLQSTQERLRILQMKTSNLMNCLDILQECARICISYQHSIAFSPPLHRSSQRDFTIFPIMRIFFSKAFIIMKRMVSGEVRRGLEFIRIVRNMHSIVRIHIFTYAVQHMLFYAHLTI